MRLLQKFDTAFLRHSVHSSYEPDGLLQRPCHDGSIANFVRSISASINVIIKSVVTCHSVLILKQRNSSRAEGDNLLTIEQTDYTEASYETHGR